GVQWDSLLKKELVLPSRSFPIVLESKNVALTKVIGLPKSLGYIADPFGDFDFVSDWAKEELNLTDY
ncbi:MAG: hypothetical protein SGCHY_004748, partial [Lobulomycetales sp.]